MHSRGVETESPMSHEIIVRLYVSENDEGQRAVELVRRAGLRAVTILVRGDSPPELMVSGTAYVGSHDIAAALYSRHPQIPAPMPLP